ncbi:hypothetical protein K2173_024604 [Erythroxylum novogranatense]|uniref:Protein kinase domain-containing protein n=1 Tax=Erythroxylum novogranatense TaxID=1862640 RepID=A0AAV8SUT2_9ROSI|nr:hypothetical protein K2173_024604 [Erythroxylum novogranatense]
MSEMGSKVGVFLVIFCVAVYVTSVLGFADPGSWPNQTPLSFGRKRHEKLVAEPTSGASHFPLSFHQSSNRALHAHNDYRPSSIALAPSVLPFEDPANKWMHGSAHLPLIVSHRNHHARKHVSTPAPPYSSHLHLSGSTGPSISPIQSPYPSSWRRNSLAPAKSPHNSPSQINIHIQPPAKSPVDYSFKKTKSPPPLHMMTLPPPPPSDCTSVTCAEPLTNTPPGSPCACVWPIQVKLHLGVAIDTFFTLVTELAEEIAAGVALNDSQVRIMGANAASEQLDKSTVLINLVPRRLKFDDTTALWIYKKFWNRQVQIKASVFGPYEVLNVQYPGLPPSPPSPSTISTSEDGSYAGHGNNGRINKPLGVDVPRWKKNGLSKSIMAVIIASTFTVLVICIAIVWLFISRYRTYSCQPQQVQPPVVSSPAKPSGTSKPTTFASMADSKSVSLTAGAMTYTGSAKTFTLIEIERATNNFDSSRILGEGGFGVVYRGKLDNEKEVAVKVLKRDDQHGSREFLAEIEMLGRLHHRNLVKLIGICTEGHLRCLVYELIPNGSVESHLHGLDKERSPLDWDARMKIALGAARGLAYLHEDSNPRVIHRDFKSSNILLEHDFTPKVSDFGLARTAVDEGNKHISTHVMGTFGYLAPEYAMTGHLLVKSDVYSYGVVLLELLTGRKPVDLSQPPGQENLVAYSRPLLTIKEGLETITDPVIKSTISFDTIAKVAAIASMCVQPEVSHRPFMGEVVQALKLVCNEFDEAEVPGSTSCSHEKLQQQEDNKNRRVSGELREALPPDKSLPLSSSELLTTPTEFEGQESESFRRHSTSGPLMTERRQLWQRLRSLSRGSMSEHGLSQKQSPGTS